MLHFKPETKPSELKGTRRAARDSLLLLATVQRTAESGADPLPVRVRNVSAVGLMADFADHAVAGEPVLVNLRGLGKVPGRVAWVRRGRIGIAFDMPVDAKAVRRRPGGA